MHSHIAEPNPTLSTIAEEMRSNPILARATRELVQQAACERQVPIIEGRVARAFVGTLFFGVLDILERSDASA